jgi:hypothetical protein
LPLAELCGKMGAEEDAMTYMILKTTREWALRQLEGKSLSGEYREALAQYVRTASRLMVFL